MLNQQRRIIAKYFIFLLCSVGLPLSTSASELSSAVSFPSERTQYMPQWKKYFDQQNVAGTLVLFDVSANRYSVYNPSRALERMSPASTFKLFNSLVALDTGVVSSEREPIPADGKTLATAVQQWDSNKGIKQYSSPMDMREAIRVSCVVCYQELAKRIGRERLQQALDNTAYGNRTLGNILETSWLDGSLAISAKEQADFTARLATGNLPFSARSIDAVQQMSVFERTIDTILYGKTGWPPKQSFGWWVGWLKHHDKIYSFALNIDIKSSHDLPKRIRIVRHVLHDLGLISYWE